MTSETDPPSSSPHVFGYWEGRLDEWLHLIATEDPDAPSPKDWHFFSFPTPNLLSEYLDSIHDRDEDEIRTLLRWFLFGPATLGADESFREFLLAHRGKATGLAPPPKEYARDLMRSLGGAPAQPGLRWTLDLLPHWPHAALRVIESYQLVYAQTLPDGRMEGLADASAVIRARWLSMPATQMDAVRATLTNLRPRELEQLLAAAYRAAGYQVRLTPATRDGGRDIEAEITTHGMRQRIFIECKQWTGTVGVDVVRGLRGVISDDRATLGVVVATGRFSLEAQAFADRDDQLNLIDGDALIPMLDETLGQGWHQNIDRMLALPPSDPQ